MIDPRTAYSPVEMRRFEISVAYVSKNFYIGQEKMRVASINWPMLTMRRQLSNVYSVLPYIRIVSNGSGLY
jgi:hypothetical protein